jgi:superfamily II DNA or RNA helicase
MKAEIGTTGVRVLTRSPHDVETLELATYLDKTFRRWDFNQRLKMKEPGHRYYLYNARTGRFIIPTGIWPEVKAHMDREGYEIETVDIPPIRPKKAHLKMRPEYKDRPHQVPIIENLVNDGPHLRVLPLQTGQGKTYISIKAMVLLQRRTLIVSSGHVEQWKEKLQAYTTIDDRLYIIKGAPSIHALRGAESTKYDVFLCSLETLRNYIVHGDPYKGCMPYAEFLEHFGIGLKIVDEVHESFVSILRVDLMSNIDLNIYLSATPTRAHHLEQRVFKSIFTPDTHVDIPNYIRYAKVYGYSYNLYISTKEYLRMRGYMHSKYETALLKRRSKLAYFIKDVLLTVIHSHYLNIKSQGEKCLIFFSTIEMCETVKNEMQLLLPNVDVRTYTGNDKDEVFMDDKAEIIISTPKKCGTGTDVPLLRTVVDTVSRQNRTSIIQMLGRLREMEEGHDPEYIYVYNSASKAQTRHAWTKKSVLAPRALRYMHFRI